MITLTAKQAQQIEEALLPYAYQYVEMGAAYTVTKSDALVERALTILRAARAQEQAEKEPVDMKDAIIAGNEILLNEQAWLLRECRGMLDALIEKFPKYAGILCGSTTIGNLRAELGKYRPSGVMKGAKND